MTRTTRKDIPKTDDTVTADGFVAKSRYDRAKMLAGIILMLLATYLGIVFFSYLTNAAHDQSLIENRPISYLVENNAVRNTGGPVGAWLSQTLISGWLGVGTIILIFYMAAVGFSLAGIHRMRFWTLTLKSLLSAITLSMVLGYATLNIPSVINWGGNHGYYINRFLVENTGQWGALCVNIVLIALTVLVFYNDLLRSWRRYKKKYDQRRRRMILERHERQEREAAQAAAQRRRAREENATPAEARETPVVNIAKVAAEAAEKAESPGDHPSETTVPSATTMTVTQAVIEEAPENVRNDMPETYDPTAELSRFRFPSLDLLYDRPVNENSVDLCEQEENKENITRTLNGYGIEISHIEATVGPTVTLYEIIPAEGVRIANIKRLENDIARSLAALGIRIIAPIPGKGTIGIEVPNKDPQTVPIRSILGSKKYAETNMALPMALGLTIEGDVFISDLAKTPHLLVAGATGMGKSVGLNTIIASLLYKKHPAELKFVLVDPKMVEFSLYNKLERHYLAKLSGEEEAIITDPKKVVNTLNSLCVEMDNRYSLLKMAGDRNIKDYNKRFTQRRLNPEKGHRYMPYIVVIVDEFADLIMTAGKEVETPIARLAQKARAVGIHLILATQRPSTNVITGIIKANFPARMAFRVSQMVDSRTILDRPGANQLIGRGDMLFSQDGNITRVQCAFIDTPEVESICQDIDNQVGYEDAYILPEYVPETEGGSGDFNGNNFGERDTLFDEAARFVVTSGIASTSGIQRRYSIGYNRAGKIMDQMEAAGIVGPAQGGKPRSLLVDIVALEAILEQYS